jgi:hypothetical protein
MGNTGPFLRPEGSPFFAAYTDPTVWRLMQQVLRAGDVVGPDRCCSPRHKIPLHSLYEGLQCGG